VKAAIYARYSTDLQDKTSIDGQFRNCEDFCKRQDLEIVCRFSDEGITGTDDSRPGYRSLRDAAERGDFDVIVVDETSRLTRNPGSLLNTMDELQYRDQALLDTKGFDSRQQSAMLMAGVYGGMDRMELDKIKERTHRGLRERAEHGHWTGGKTYGYRSEPIDSEDPKSQKRLVIQQDEAEIVREAFALYADGIPPKQIANLLNERGIPSPGSSWKRTKRRTKGWVHTAFVGTADRGTGMFRNELYAGQLIWNKRRSKKVPGTSRRKYAMRPRSEWVINDAPELRIVSEAIWDRVQNRLAANRQKATQRRESGRGYHRSKYLLSGILQCGICESNFIMADARAYRCSSHTNGGQHCCSNSHRVRRDIVEPILLRGVKRDLLTDEALAEMRGIVAKEQRSEKSRLAVATKELRKADAAIERVTEAISEVGLSRALQEKLRELERRREDLEGQIKVAKDSTPAELMPRIVDRWRSLVDGLEDLSLHPDARAEDIEEAREQLSKILGRVRLVPEDGHLVALVGLQAQQDAGLHIRMVAGVGFEPTTFGL
jgi:site-specific DNA recombinase